MRYPTTPTLSLAPLHRSCTCENSKRIAVKLAGALGAILSTGIGCGAGAGSGTGCGVGAGTGFGAGAGGGTGVGVGCGIGVGAGVGLGTGAGAGVGVGEGVGLGVGVGVLDEAPEITLAVKRSTKSTSAPGVLPLVPLF